MSKLDPNVPRHLYDLQKWFGKVISRPIKDFDIDNLPILDRKMERIGAKNYIFPTDGLSSEQRIAIYKMQYWLRVFAVMKEDFPLVLRLFGTNIFEKKIVTSYLTRYPSNSWSLEKLGERFPKWIEKYYPNTLDKNLIYNAAKIDYSYCKILYAPCFCPIDNISPNKKIYLQPFVEVFSFFFDLLSFRKKTLQEDDTYWIKHPFPKIEKLQETFFIVYRIKDQVVFEKIDTIEYTMLYAFQQGASICQAVDYLEDNPPSTTMQSYFRKWASNSWLTAKRN